MLLDYLGRPSALRQTEAHLSGLTFQGPGDYLAEAKGKGQTFSLVNVKFFTICPDSSKASLVAQRLKRLPAMWETWVRSLGQEDPLEKEKATHCSILAWRIPWTEEPGGLQSTGSQRVGHH